MTDLIALQRTKPNLFNYSYFVCRNNLNGMKYLQKIATEKKLRILDIGCGSKPFKSLFPSSTYLGIDIDKNTTAADIVVNLNQEKIPYRNKSFDVIIISETLEHVFNTNLVLREIDRLLKKRGFLFISTPFIFHYHGDPEDYFRFTKYFYLRAFNKYKILLSSPSNSIISTPILYISAIIAPLPIIFKPVILINNLLVLLIETISGFISLVFRHNKKVLNYLFGAPVGQYFLFQK